MILITLATVSFKLIVTGKNIGILLNVSNRKLYKIFTDMLDVRNFVILSVFYIGDLYGKLEKRISINVYLAIICIIVIYCNTKINTIEMSQYDFVGPIYFILNTILGVYLNIYTVKIICFLKFKMNIIEWVEKYSFIYNVITPLSI